jgi:hypothetical protein
MAEKPDHPIGHSIIASFGQAFLGNEAFRMPPIDRWCLALTRRSCYFIHGGNNRLKS